jgi:cytoskeletal protein RodZ
MTEGSFPGHALREQREALGYSLADIYARVHIPPRYATGLETGDFSVFPAPTYALGFINSYCQFLELDPEPFLAACRAAIRSPQAGHYPVRRRRVANPNPDGRPLWVSDLITWGAICAVLALCWITYAVVTQPFAEDGSGRVDAGSVSIEAPALLDDPY